MSENKLSRTDIDELLVEIITGKRLFQCMRTNEIYAVRFPTIQEKDSARIIYSKNFKELKSSGIPTKEEMELKIEEYEILPKSHFFFKKNMKSTIEGMEDSLKISNSEHQKASLKIDIDRARMSLMRLEEKENRIYENTAEVRAEDARIGYLLSCVTMKGDELNERYWKTYLEYKEYTDYEFSSVAKRNFIRMYMGISADKLRAVARSYEWRNRWKASKQTGSPIFAGASSDWDKNKVSICYWSDFYDTIFGYSTPPPEEIIEDDEKLFDWIREVNRINAQETNKAASASQANGKKKKVNSPYRVRPKKQGNSFTKI